MSENVQNRLEEVEQNALGPGRMLREARKVQQIDQAELATRLNLDLRLVDAVERDDFDHMPPATFIKGYLRAYAREVGLNPDAVVEEFDRVTVQDTPTLKSRHSVQRQADLSDSPMRWVSIALVLILVGLVGTWMVRNFQPGATEVAPVTEETAAEVESMAAAAEQQAAGEQPITMASERSESDVAETPAPSSEAASSSEGVGAETTSETAQAASSSEGSVAAGASEAETPVAEAPIAQELPQAGVSGEADQLAAAENSENSQVASAEPEAVQAAPDAVAENAESAAESESAGEAGSQQVVTEAPAPAPVVDPDAPLIMSFTDDCWTSVQAADGERLVYRVVKKGAVLNIHGEAPFRITLGNSDVVKVVYQGDLIDHQPFSRGKIARFVLNADGSAN